MDSFLKNPSLRASFYDAIFFSVMVGLGESFFSAFAIHLHASPFQLGILAALPVCLSAPFQVVGLTLTEYYRKRRLLIVGGVFLQALSWIPIVFLAYAPSGEFTVWWFIFAVVIYYAFGGLVVPAWNSLMGDLVEPKVRGKYFGYRNSWAGIAMLFGMFVGGVFLEVGKQHGWLITAYAILFGGAGISRAFSCIHLNRHDEPVYNRAPSDYFSFVEFIRKLPESNYAKFVLFHGLVMLGVFIAAPYFPLYLLRYLEMPYWQFTALICVGLFSQFYFMNHWGEICDNFGSKKVLVWSSVGIVSTPFLWLFSSSFLYLFFVQLVSGFLWAGFTLATSNFMFDAVTPGKRARCTAYSSLIVAALSLLGSLLGAQLFEFMKVSQALAVESFIPYRTLFIVSGFVRLIVVLLCLSKFREVRDIEHATPMQFLVRISHVRPFAGVSFATIFRRKRTS